MEVLPKTLINKFIFNSKCYINHIINDEMSAATAVFLELLWLKMFDHPTINRKPRPFPFSSLVTLQGIAAEHALVTKDMIKAAGFNSDCINGLMAKIPFISRIGTIGWSFSSPKYLEQSGLFAGLMCLDLDTLDWLTMDATQINVKLINRFPDCAWDGAILSNLILGMKANVSHIFGVPYHSIYGSTYTTHKFKNCLWDFVCIPNAHVSFLSLKEDAELTFFRTTRPKTTTFVRFGLTPHEIELRLRLSGALFRVSRSTSGRPSNEIDSFAGYLLFLMDLRDEYRGDAENAEKAFIKLLVERTINFDFNVGVISHGFADPRHVLTFYRKCWVNYDRISTSGLNDVFDSAFPLPRAYFNEPLRRFSDLEDAISDRLYDAYVCYIDSINVVCSEPYQQVRLEMLTDMYINQSFYNVKEPTPSFHRGDTPPPLPVPSTPEHE